MPANMDSVPRYLKGMKDEQKARPGPKLHDVPFITISRQAGAGGRSLAEAIIKRLEAGQDNPLFQNWHIFDRELCEKVAEDPGIQVSLESLLNEEVRNPPEDVIFRMIAREASQARVHGKIFKTVRDFAAVGKAIIVGRGGACLTRGFPHGIHVRLVAPRPSRVRHAAVRFEMSQVEAERWVDGQDKHRARLVRKYFRKDIEDFLLYDCVWNTDAVALDTIAEALVVLIEKSTARAVG